jgi:hypothetical protein
MEPGCIGKSNTNNLPAPTDLTENPYGKKKLVFKDATPELLHNFIYILELDIFTCFGPVLYEGSMEEV